MVVCSFLTLSGYGQYAQISGLVKDASSGEPLAYANVFLMTQQNKGVVTNAIGRFQMALHAESLNDTLLISAVGYQVERISLKQPIIDTVILLRPSALLLDEVTVTYKENVHRILRKAINRIPKNYGTRKFLAKAYYEEYSVIDTQYVEFIESMINVTDRRFVSPEDESIIKLEQMRRVRERTEPMPSEVEKYFAFDRIYTIYERMNNVRQRQFFSLEQKPQERSTYKIEHYREYGEDGDTLIEVGYKSHQTKQEGTVGYAGSTGIIVLDKKDLAILKMTRGNEADHTFHEVTYRKVGDKYFPSRIAYKYAVKAPDGKQYAVSRALYVYEIQEAKKKALGKRLERTMDLRDVPHKYDPEFWKDNQVLLSISARDALQADLKQMGNLERKFKRGQWGRGD